MALDIHNGMDAGAVHLDLSLDCFFGSELMIKMTHKVIYSGCGCEAVEHFPDFCPDCRIAELERLADKVKNGFQGGCWCCETVAMTNVELKAKLERVEVLPAKLRKQCLESECVEDSYSGCVGLLCPDEFADMLEDALKDNSG